MSDKTFKQLVLEKFPKAKAQKVKLRSPGTEDIYSIVNEENQFCLGTGATEASAWAFTYLNEVSI